MEALSALLALCVDNSPVPGEFPTQRPATRSFEVFFDLRLNKRLSKQSCGWWSVTPSRWVWRHCNVPTVVASVAKKIIKWYISIGAHMNAKHVWYQYAISLLTYTDAVHSLMDNMVLTRFIHFLQPYVAVWVTHRRLKLLGNRATDHQNRGFLLF